MSDPPPSSQPPPPPETPPSARSVSDRQQAEHDPRRPPHDPTSTRTPAEPRSPADFVYGLAVAAVIFGGIGLLISAGDNRWVYVFSLVLTSLGVISGAVGAFIGWSRGYIEPAYAAIACTCFAVLMLLIVVVSMIGAGFSPADVAEAIGQEPEIN